MYSFSQVGIDLVAIANAEPHVQYLRLVAQDICQRGFDVVLGDGLSADPDGWALLNPEVVCSKDGASL